MRKLLLAVVLLCLLVFASGCCGSARDRFGNLHNF